MHVMTCSLHGDGVADAEVNEYLGASTNPQILTPCLTSHLVHTISCMVCLLFCINNFISPLYNLQLYVYKCKNEVGCRDDTVPKTVDTRRHCEEE